MDLTELTSRLAAVDEAIRALPDDAFADKHVLLKQRDQLREQAAEYAADRDAGRSDHELLSELSGLRSQLKALDKQKINLVTQAGGGAGNAGNMGNLGGVSLNIRMSEATGANRIQSRIGVIKGVLTNRGAEFPEAN